MKKISPVVEPVRPQYPSTREVGEGTSRRALLHSFLGAAAAAVGGLALGCKGSSNGSNGVSQSPKGTSPDGASTGGTIPDSGAHPLPRPHHPGDEVPRLSGAVGRLKHVPRPSDYHAITLRLRRPFGVPGCSATFRSIVVATDSAPVMKLLRSPAERVKLRMLLSTSLTGVQCSDTNGLKRAIAKIITSHARKRLGSGVSPIRVLRLR